LANVCGKEWIRRDFETKKEGEGSSSFLFWANIENKKGVKWRQKN
jgi:hypothetical protein